MSAKRPFNLLFNFFSYFYCNFKSIYLLLSSYIMETAKTTKKMPKTPLRLGPLIHPTPLSHLYWAPSSTVRRPSFVTVLILVYLKIIMSTVKKRKAKRKESTCISSSTSSPRFFFRVGWHRVRSAVQLFVVSKRRK